MRSVFSHNARRGRSRLIPGPLKVLTGQLKSNRKTEPSGPAVLPCYGTCLRHGGIMNRLAPLIKQSSHHCRDRTALICGALRRTLGEVDARSDCLAAG